ncbi:rhsB protein in rhs element, partial [Escherichia coli TW09195]|jgi:hypothetical protein
MYT